MSTTSSHRRACVRFGEFEFDAIAEELRKHGLRLKLQKQPLCVLKFLLARPNQIVSRDESREALWPDGTHVDFDHGLNATVNRLRQVLADSADRPRYLEAVPGVGYRWVGAVEVCNPAVLDTTPARIFLFRGGPCSERISAVQR